MKIAIVGTGFTGLSCAWHLVTKGCEVTLFDARGIGCGASGIAAGLMHPYVGEESKRSLHADEGMQASLELIQVAEEKLKESVARRGGILRLSSDAEQRERLLEYSKQFGDIEPLDESRFWIKSGVTVDSPRYLKGLWEALVDKGVKLIIQEISELQTLNGFDHIVVAAGAGVAQFPELSDLKYSLLKGQVLVCQAPEGIELPEKSSVCKGYIALTQEKERCIIGSTYERTFSDSLPDRALTEQTLFPKTALLFPDVEKLHVLECKAGVRVCRKGHYFPLVGKIQDGLWVATAMGSRGLLYHGLIGKQLAEALVSGNNFTISSNP